MRCFTAARALRRPSRSWRRLGEHPANAASSAAIDVHGAFVVTPYVDMHAIARSLRDGVILKLDSVFSVGKRRPSSRGALCGARRTQGGGARLTISNAGVLQSQAEIASFMEATLPQDLATRCPRRPSWTSRRAPRGYFIRTTSWAREACPHRRRRARGALRGLVLRAW